MEYFSCSFSFQMRLESSLSLEIVQEMADFDRVYESVRAGCGVVDMGCDPAVTLCRGGGAAGTGVLCDGSVCRGGSAAAALLRVALMDSQLVRHVVQLYVLSMTFTTSTFCSLQISCLTISPFPLFEPGYGHPLRNVESIGLSKDAPVSREIIRPLPDSDVPQEQVASEDENVEAVTNEGDALPLFQEVGMSAVVRHGPLMLYPSLSIGRLLDPLHPSSSSSSSSSDLPHPHFPHSSCHQSCDVPPPLGEEPVHPPICSDKVSYLTPTNRNVESYISVCCDHFNFTSAECVYTRELYGTIEEAGEGGVEEEELWRVCANGRSGRAKQDHLNLLVNLEMVSKCPWIQFGDVSLHC